ncbi:MAG: DNA recombination protein RmuC [Candidatus Liptonbacteria bacterium]|nr:DNA recombination protein RmuC [Candidatus Liptonbacteria bacterium]
MDLALILILILILAALAGGFWFLWREMHREKEAKPDQSLLLLQNQINELSRVLDNRLGDSAKAIQTHFGESTKLIREITQELVRVGEGQKQVLSITDQLKNLQDILKNPKQRGVLGEYYLETALRNVLPPGSYQMQYPFKDGTIVDAVIFHQGKIIPIDSKFSLENYTRILDSKTDADRKKFEEAFRGDLKTRIDETSKYIKPTEGTIEFAFMYIPSEGIYYDLLVNKVGAVAARDLLEYAIAEKKVVPVSPTSFAAYLQTILMGLKQAEINKSADEIRKRVGDLGRHLMSFEEYMKKLGVQLGTASKTYSKAYQELRKIDKDVLKISGETMGVEPMTLEAPSFDEEESQALL